MFYYIDMFSMYMLNFKQIHQANQSPYLPYETKIVHRNTLRSKNNFEGKTVWPDSFGRTVFPSKSAFLRPEK